MRLAAGLIALAAFAQPRVTQHMMLLEPTGVDLHVSETLIISGEGRGRVRIAIPPAAGTPAVRNATVAKTATPGVFELSLPAAAAQETRVDISWSMPFAVPETLSGRVLHGGVVRLVVPKGVKVSSANMESNGIEPTTQAAIFTLKSPEYKIEIDGAGSLRAEQPASAAEEDGASIQQIKPRVYDRLYWILGLTLAILAAGFALNYRKPPVKP